MNARSGLPAGIHTISAADYHADPAEAPSLSNSLIKVLSSQTPRHAWLAHPRLNPNYRHDSGTGVFDIGTTAHALLLEGIDAAVVVEADDWRTKAAQEARAYARECGKIPLLSKQHAAVKNMIAAAHAYIDTTKLRGIFARGKPEQAVLWEESGVWCRALLDWLTDDRATILDYKSTGAASPREFVRRLMVAHGYDTQAVWYRRGLAAVGHRNVQFVFLVQESFAPFMCYLVEPTESMDELGGKKIARTMPLWRDCLGSDRWPGYSTDIHQAEASIWDLREEEGMT